MEIVRYTFIHASILVRNPFASYSFINKIILSLQAVNIISRHFYSVAVKPRLENFDTNLQTILLLIVEITCNLIERSSSITEFPLLFKCLKSF